MNNKEHKTKIKICGITNVEDALFCSDLGVDALGFVFAESPRSVEPAQALEIINAIPKRLMAIGVFVNEDIRVVKEVVKECGLAMIQLHGEESPEYCQKAKDIGLPIIKAFRVKDIESINAIEGYKDIDYILLDCYSRKAHGGTGEVFDWTIALKAKDFEKKMFLSGGLGPDNVREAINSIKPFAVDASSKLEKKPGIKDHTLLKEYVHMIRDEHYAKE
ncbi:MAG: phosphoribosylanthranilate isomerase [Candidatus Ancaeobacter aquaticus]|nr:phosphoribosylanthranilate isomerase [Candidatus Ancaeobacter aquaticus]